MSKIVDTGWRKITPGDCADCGNDDDWICDGRGMIYCSCNTCPECQEPNGTGHWVGCYYGKNDLAAQEEEEIERN